MSYRPWVNRIAQHLDDGCVTKATERLGGPVEYEMVKGDLVVRSMDNAYINPNKPIVNCLMLVTWPKRKEMVLEAIAGYLSQSYYNRYLMIVNDGIPCTFSPEFSKLANGIIYNSKSKINIGAKRNLGSSFHSSDYIAVFDDDDISLPERLGKQILSVKDSDHTRFTKVYVALNDATNILGPITNRTCLCTSMISTSQVVEKKWGDGQYGEDMFLWKQINEDKTSLGVSELNDNCVVYRRHENNITKFITGETEKWYKFDDMTFDENKKIVSRLNLMFNKYPGPYLKTHHNGKC